MTVVTTTLGPARNGVVLVGERPPWDGGTDVPFRGKSGFAFTLAMQRRGLKREEFGLIELPYGQAEGLDAALRAMRPKVIVALTTPQTQRPASLLIDNYDTLDKVRGYVEWSTSYQCWVIATYAPLWVQTGNQRLTGVMLADIERGLEVARDGYLPAAPLLYCDPPLTTMAALVADFERQPVDTTLTYDIETPHSGETIDEEELDIGDPSYIIDRISFSWKDHEGVSVPFTPAYRPYIERLLASPNGKIGHNLRYDVPRLLANSVALHGVHRDTMWMWHFLNSDLPKGLGFIVPLLLKGYGRWKHLSSLDPARYSALDSVVTHLCAHRLTADLRRLQLWEVFQRHCVQLDTILGHMTQVGMLVDDGRRRELSATLSAEMERLSEQMQEVVPLAGKRTKDYKGKPKGVEWALGDPAPDGFTVKVVPTPTPFCPACGIEKPDAAHRKVYKRKVNLCGGVEPVIREVMKPRLSRIQRFVPSNQQMQTYLDTMGHRGVGKRKQEGPGNTFDALALEVLRKRYPKDPLYPLVLDYRETEKILGTYVGKWDAESGRWIGGPPLGPDGAIHPIFTHNPSTLRLASQGPNAQNIPEALRVLFVPRKGERLVNIDYKAIEAQIVGFLAGSPTYTRLAKLGVHDFLNSHILARAGKIGRPADLGWGDDDLREMFKELKARFKSERDISKRCVHLSNYMGTPAHMAEIYPDTFPTTKAAAEVQAIYFEVCPDIPRWQRATIRRAHDTGYLVNPFGYIHRFWDVRKWERGEERDGTDAKRCVAYGPQSTAAGIIKEAMLAFWETAFGHTLRLQVHDSLVCAFPTSDFDEGVETLVEVMERPIECLRLPWNPTECLRIETEVKVGAEGQSWGELSEVSVRRGVAA